jgi:hypothetical protein
MAKGRFQPPTSIRTAKLSAWSLGFSEVLLLKVDINAPYFASHQVSAGSQNLPLAKGRLARKLKIFALKADVVWTLFFPKTL